MQTSTSASAAGSGTSSPDPPSTAPHRPAPSGALPTRSAPGSAATDPVIPKGSASGARWGRQVDVAVAVVVLLVLWEIVARIWFPGSTSIAPPSAVFAQMWADRDLLLRNTSSTVVIAVLGFAVGNVVAIIGAALFVLFSVFERVFSHVALALYALPTLVLAPVLGVFMGPEATRVTVAALVVYFPTLIAVTAGLREPTAGTLDLVHSLGGGRFTALRLVRARWSLPGLCAGMRVAVPGALLGAIASEWLGADTGLGIFMVNALGYLNTARVWGCCLVCIVLTVLGYALVGLLNRIVNGWQPGERSGE